MTKTGRPRISDEPTVTRSFSLTPDQRDTLTIAARRLGISQSALIRDILDEWVKAGKFGRIFDTHDDPLMSPEMNASLRTPDWLRTD